jgi:hypothetical protein
MHGRSRRGVHLPGGARDLLAGELVPRGREARLTELLGEAAEAGDTDALLPTALTPSQQSSPDNT